MYSWGRQQLPHLLSRQTASALSSSLDRPSLTQGRSQHQEFILLTSSFIMSKPERVLRLAGSYYRTKGLSEEEFYNYMSRRHGAECAKTHEKYGILKYQMVGAHPFSS